MPGQHAFQNVPRRRSAPPAAAAMPSLFDPPVTSRQARDRAVTAATGKHAAELARFAPLFRQWMIERGEFGLTVGEFRHKAVALGLLPLKAPDRSLSYLVSLPRYAGGVPNGLRRLSPLPGTRNINQAYVLGRQGKRA